MPIVIYICVLKKPLFLLVSLYLAQNNSFGPYKKFNNSIVPWNWPKTKFVPRNVAYFAMSVSSETFHLLKKKWAISFPGLLLFSDKKIWIWEEVTSLLLGFKDVRSWICCLFRLTKIRYPLFENKALCSISLLTLMQQSFVLITWHCNTLLLYK